MQRNYGESPHGAVLLQVCLYFPGSNLKSIITPSFRYLRKCQTYDWKSGNPPHKKLCGKLLGDLPFTFDGLDQEPLRSFTLYTTTPSPALRIQIEFLRREKGLWDYCYVQEDGRPLFKCFHDEFKTIFLKARKSAMESRDLASIAVMEILLNLSAPEGSEDYRDFATQLEKEYEVDIGECKRVAERQNADYGQLLRMLTAEEADRG